RRAGVSTNMTTPGAKSNRGWTSLFIVLLTVFLFGDDLVAVFRHLQLSRLSRRRGAAFLRTRRECRQQPVDLFALARRALDEIAATHQPLEFAVAAPAMKLVERHRRYRPPVPGAGFTETATCTFVQQHWKPPPPSPVESFPWTRRTYSPGALNVAVVDAFPSASLSMDGLTFSNFTAAGPR